MAASQKLLVIVHHLEQARSVLAVAKGLMVDVELRSAPGAAAYAGVAYLHELGKAIGRDILIDCEDDPSLVMGGLRTGCRRLIFDGPADSLRRLKDMAESCGAAVYSSADMTTACLALSPDDEEDVIRDRLAALKA